MKRAIFCFLFLLPLLFFSKHIRFFSSMYAHIVRIREYDHIEKGSPFIEIERGFREVLAIDRSIFPKGTTLMFDLDLSNRKTFWRGTEERIIEGERYMQKTFFQKGWVRSLLLPSKGLSFWNNGWRLQGKIGTIKPAFLYSKWDWSGQISVVLYPLEGKRIKEASFNQKQKSLDYASFEVIERALQEHRIYHQDLMIWNFIQIPGEGLKIIDLEDVTQFPPYSYLFYRMHRRDRKKIALSKEAYETMSAR